MKPKIMSCLACVASLALVAACGSEPQPIESTPQSSALTTGEHVWTTADGNRIPYEVSGEGDVNVLLVHCWMCDRSFWSSQIPELSKSYRTIALDLPGHGQATAKRATWSVAAYGADVAGLIDALDLSRVVLVGHSMGGPVSLRAAALAPGRVIGIVAVDTLHDAEFDFSGDEVETIMKAFESDYVSTCEQFVAQMFPEQGVEEIQAHVKEAGCAAERSEIGVALMRDFGTIDMAGWFSEANVRIRAVNASGPNPTRTENNRKYADYDAVLMEGVGHYLHMTRPREFNPLLIAAISEIVDGAP